MRKEKGITLIALVVTIVVLLILAGVSISMLTGENGIITQANNAKLQNEFGEVTEGMTLVASEYVMEKNDGEIQDFLTWLETKKIIDGSGKISTQDLLNRTLSTGNGTGTNDIYQLKQSSEESGQYDILYYYKDGKDVNLKTLTISGDMSKAYPEAIPQEEDFIYRETEKGIEIIGIKRDDTDMYSIKGEITNVVIPMSIEGKNVVSIKNKTFEWCYIESITIPNTVEIIEEKALFNDKMSEIKQIIFHNGKNPELEISEDKWGAGSDVQIIGENGEILK